MFELNWLPSLIGTNWIESYDSAQLFLSGDLNKFRLITPFLIPADYLYSDVLPLTSTWKMVKDAHNHIPMNMIGLAQTSCEILEYSDILILPVVLIILTSKVYPKKTCRY